MISRYTTSLSLGRTALIITIILVILGIVSLISASAVIGLQAHQDVFYFVKRQLLQGIIFGLFLSYLVYKIPLDFWRKAGGILLLLNIVLIALCFVPSLQAPGATARRWLKFGSFTIQPSEFLKITYPAFLASILAKYPLVNRRKKFPFSFLIFLISLIVISLFIIKQPSTGTLFTIVLSSIAMYLIAGMNFSQLIILSLIIVLGGIYVVKNTPYRLARIETFFAPESDPLGKGYHIAQSLIGIGSGGLWGVGFGRSVQKFHYLPESHTDAIFAIIAEEFGFIGAVIILLLYLLLFSVGLKISQKAKNSFESFFALGLISSICLQALINIAGMTKLMPLTGVPLPFISYGGTAMITALMSITLLYKISSEKN